MIIEPGAGDCTFSITIWLICHYLFRSTLRVIAIEIDPVRHAASRQWLHHYLGNGTVTDLPHHLPLIFCVDFC